MSNDKEMWLLTYGLTGPTRAVTGREDMLRKVCALVENNVVKNDPAWRGMSERPVSVGETLWAYRFDDHLQMRCAGWQVSVTRILGPDDVGF